MESFDDFLFQEAMDKVKKSINSDSIRLTCIHLKTHYILYDTRYDTHIVNRKDKKTRYLGRVSELTLQKLKIHVISQRICILSFASTKNQNFLNE